MTVTYSLREEAVSWTPTDAGAVVILDLRTSQYLTLNNSAAALWRKLADGATREELSAQLQQTYSLDQVTAQRDVEAFLADLRRRDMLDE